VTPSRFLSWFRKAGAKKQYSRSYKRDTRRLILALYEPVWRYHERMRHDVECEEHNIWCQAVARADTFMEQHKEAKAAGGEE
jgi:hypothetical protein